MALWLELIPKIHRSDELERRFHVLDDHDNRTAFERDGTRQLLLDEPLVDDRRQLATTAATTSSTSSSTPHPPTSSVPARRASTARRPATTPRRSVGATPSKAGSLAVVELASANAPLSVTVAVGCALLLLNVAVFVVVCRQKRRAQLKLGAAGRFRSRDELKHGGGGDTESACFDSNRSSVSSYSLAASVQHGDYGRCRNVRFCEARAPAAAAAAAAAAATSPDGGPTTAYAARRLPPRPGRGDNDVKENADNEATTAASNHLNNPSTTV